MCSDEKMPLNQAFAAWKKKPVVRRQGDLLSSNWRKFAAVATEQQGTGGSGGGRPPPPKNAQSQPCQRMVLNQGVSFRRPNSSSPSNPMNGTEKPGPIGVTNRAKPASLAAMFSCFLLSFQDHNGIWILDLWRQDSRNCVPVRHVWTAKYALATAASGVSQFMAARSKRSESVGSGTFSPQFSSRGQFALLKLIGYRVATI
jgi:hypothetical protein